MTNIFIEPETKIITMNGDGPVDVFSCPTNQYLGLLDISNDKRSKQGVRVSVYKNAYEEDQKGTHINLSPGVSTTVLASRILISVPAETSGGGEVAVCVRGIYPVE